MEGGDAWFSFMLNEHITPPPSEVITISETSTDNNDSDTEVVDVDDEDDDDEQSIIVISDEEDAGEQCMFIYTHISCTTLFVKQIGENKNFSFDFLRASIYGAHYSLSAIISLYRFAIEFYLTDNYDD